MLSDFLSLALPDANLLGLQAEIYRFLFTLFSSLKFFFSKYTSPHPSLNIRNHAAYFLEYLVTQLLFA